MAISHKTLDDRINTLVNCFKTADYLEDGLPDDVYVNKGPAEAIEGPTQHFEIFISRMGLPKFDYGGAGENIDVTQEMAIACQTYFPEDRETMETYVAYLSANVMRCLIENIKVNGDKGWRTGIINNSDAVRFRNNNNSAYELEIFSFLITFEVDGPPVR